MSIGDFTTGVKSVTIYLTDDCRYTNHTIKMSMIKTLELNWQITFSFLWKLLYTLLNYNLYLCSLQRSAVRLSTLVLSTNKSCCLGNGSIDFDDILIQMATSLQILLNFNLTTWPWYLLTTFGGNINTWVVNTIDNFKID